MGATLQTPRDIALAPHALGAAQAIEDELRRLGWWSLTPPPAERLSNPGPFGQNGMSGPQWLQFVLLDRVRTTAAGQGSFPQASSVGTWAFREFDGVWEADPLIARLRELDALFEPNLHVLAAGGNPRCYGAFPQPLLLDDPELFALPQPDTDPALVEQLNKIKSLLEHSRDVNQPHKLSGLAPLHLAIACGCDAAERLLLERGADPECTDRAGRNAMDWRMLRVQARLRRVLPGMATVRSARLVQIYLTQSRRFSTAVVVIEADGPVSADALAGLPPTDPVVITLLASDAISVMARHEVPFWQRELQESP